MISLRPLKKTFHWSAYSQVDKLKYQFKKWEVEILEMSYTNNCEALVRVRDDLATPFLQGDFFQYTEVHDV